MRSHHTPLPCNAISALPGKARPRQADALRRRIEMFTPVRIEFSGPAFHFGDGARMPAPGPGQLRVLAPEEAPKVSAAFPRLAASVASRTPIVAMLEDDRVLSACYAATGPGPAVEAGVDTVDAARGRGFAPRVVAAWAAEVRAAGRIPLYSTAWTNTASRAVARKLELVPYGTDWHLR